MKKVNLTVGKLLLEELGCRVKVAKDGVEAFNKAIKEKFDVVLMDIQMPRMNGIEATKEIKDVLDQPPVVIALSANNMQGDKEKYLSNGLDDFLPKPIRVDFIESMFKKHFLEKALFAHS